MKKLKVTFLIVICSLTNFYFCQQLQNAPNSLLLNSINPNSPPSVEMLFENFKNLLSNPDSTLNHEKINAQRWMRYSLPKYNISNSNQYSLDEYSEAIKSLYSSPLNCGQNDQANWISDGPTSIPDTSQQKNGWVDAIYNNPLNTNVFLLGTRTSGIFRTTDSGNNWSCVTDNLSFPVLGIQQIIAAPNNPNYILAITGTQYIKGGVIYSNDGGITWNECTQTLPQFTWLDFHPTIPGLVFASTNENVMYSQDYGLSWQSLGWPPSFNSQFRLLFKIIVLENKFFVTTRYLYGLESYLFRGDFTVSATGLSNQWSSALNDNFASGETVTFVDFSNKIGNRFYLQVKSTTNKRTFKTMDMGNSFSLLNFPVEIGTFWKNELIASPNNPNAFYWGQIGYMRRYNEINGTAVQIVNAATNPGHHNDYRCSHILNISGVDRISFGNDGGAAIVFDGLASNPKISSINGNISINLLHAFDIHEPTGRIAYAFQDHAMKYRNADMTYSDDFLWEGSAALIQQLYPNGIVGENAYTFIQDKDELNHPIVNGILGTPGECYLGGYFITYRHFPDRFARGLNAISSEPYGKVAMNRGENISEESNILMSKGIGPVAICERNPNYIYAADNVPGDNVNKFYRSLDDGLTWESLTNSTVTLSQGTYNLSQQLTWNVIRALAVDPYDGNIVYCGIGGTHVYNNSITDQRFRVIKSNDGGLTFTDFSEGLPALPIERLLTIESTNGLMFCATSVGVYYRTNTMSQWECFSKNLPKVEITGIKYDYCNNTLYVSTYGRGMWKTEVNLGVSSDFSDLITVNTIWNTNKVLTDNLIIKAGATLTINSTVKVYTGKKIIIEPKARLILDGGILTSFCGDYWQGIEVWGNSNLTQTAANQGTVILKNGATIEYAREAIQVWKYNDWSKTGGIIDASNSYFKNNWRSIAYYPYHSYSPVSGNEYPNKGRITNCEFTWDDNFLNINGVAPAITMNHVNGVVIGGCDFIDNRTTIVNPHQRPNGIYTIDAGYKVVGRNIGGLNTPVHHDYSETNYDVCKFKNLQHGVYAMNSNSQFTVTVDHCKFEDMIYGVRLSSVDNALITRNKFDFTLTHPTDITVMHELVFDKCTGYKAEGNKFNSQIPSAPIEGTLVYNSGVSQNRIYRNDYTNVMTGNYSNGQNTNDMGGTNAPSGLQFLCNDHLNNQNFDEYVFTFPNANGNGQGIRLKQGSSAESAGNTLSSNLNPLQGKANIKSDDFDNIIYFVGSGNNQIPSVIGGVGTQLSFQNNGCLSTFSNTIVIQQKSILSPTVKSELIAELQSIGTQQLEKAIELDNLLQTGDSPYLHELVANLTPYNKQFVRSELSANSPYLSELLLKEVGDKTPGIYPHAWYKDLILANIEVAQTKTFIDYLISKNVPLPFGLINQINEQKLITTTQRGEKIDFLTDLNTRKTVILDLLIQNELSDTVEIDWQAYNNWITQREDIICKSQMADMHLGKGEIIQCNEKLDYIDVHINEFMMDEIKQEMSDYSTFKKYVLTFVNEDGIIESLDSTQIEQLEYIANNFSGKSAVQARNLLCFHVGLCEDIEVVYATPNNAKSAQATNESSEESAYTINQTLKVIPNPNNGEFKLVMPENCTIQNLQIIDIHGKEILFETIEDNGEYLKLKMENTSTGIYTLKTNCSDGSVFVTRLLIK